MDKVRQVSEHVNMILRHIPYVQTNFVLGLDSDSGDEPFELTKKFVDLAPGAFPGYSLLSAFGRAAPLNLEYQRANRVLPFPFHFLDNNHAMNVKPKNYSWSDFYGHVIDLTRHTFSKRAIVNRFRSTRTAIPRWMNVVRAVSSEGSGRLAYYSRVRALLDSDPASAAVLREGIDRASAVLRGPGAARPGLPLGMAARGRDEPRPERLPRGRAGRFRGRRPRARLGLKFPGSREKLLPPAPVGLNQGR